MDSMTTLTNLRIRLFNELLSGAYTIPIALTAMGLYANGGILAWIGSIMIGLILAEAIVQ